VGWESQLEAAMDRDRAVIDNACVGVRIAAVP
jgi:hypothetical protein